MMMGLLLATIVCLKVMWRGYLLSRLANSRLGAKIVRLS